MITNLDVQRMDVSSYEDVISLLFWNAREVAEEGSRAWPLGEEMIGQGKNRCRHQRELNNYAALHVRARMQRQQPFHWSSSLCTAMTLSLLGRDFRLKV